MDMVTEKLQQVLHDLHDLTAFSGQAPFQGMVINNLPFQYRDIGLSHWTIRIEPYMPRDTLAKVDEVLAEDVTTEGEDDEAVRTGPEG